MPLAALPPALQHKKPDGTPYTRREPVEKRLVELSILPRAELARLCEIEDRKNPQWVSSECLLHFVRQDGRQPDPPPELERLYVILLGRVVRALPNPRRAGGAVDHATLELAERAADDFKNFLFSDRTEYCARLDAYEVTFDLALVHLRADARRRLSRHQKGAENLEDDAQPGALAEKVEIAAGSFDRFDWADFERKFYRRDLDAAIDSLSDMHRRIIQMTRLEIPVESADPFAITMTKVLRKSDKTVRTEKQNALAALRTALTGGATP